MLVLSSGWWYRVVDGGIKKWIEYSGRWLCVAVDGCVE